MRLDAYIAEKGLSKSRSFAKLLIEEGYVKVNGYVRTKPSFEVSPIDDVEVTGKPYTYVSRGGVKLESALKSFKFDVAGLVCADIGASSGGFTDCLLKYGAAKVFAIDAGSGQLDASLLKDERVINIENFNARNLTPEHIGETCELVVTDVSFISQTLIIPSVFNVLCQGGSFISLIKPQFECGRSGLGKGGIVKSKKIMLEALENVISFANRAGLGCEGLIRSPITGGDGNTEFLMICKKNKERTLSNEYVKEICLS